MANIGAAISKNEIEVNDGAYIERKDSRETRFEQILRANLAKFNFNFVTKYRWKSIVAQANQREDETKNLTDQALCTQFHACTQRMQIHGFSPALLSESFALIRQASWRTLKMRPHDVQLVGVWSILTGQVAEMATGEGKTLVAALAASIGASAGLATHVVTVNDYLSKRDAHENMPLFDFLGLSVGSIEQDMEPDDRRKQYACDITYASNKEIVFDYLKDRIALRGLIKSHIDLRNLYNPNQSNPALLRGLHLAIVDEADSVLIDEARTPLIISETLPDELGQDLYQQALDFGLQMVSPQHYELSRDKQIHLNPAGELHINALAQAALSNTTKEVSPLWRSPVWQRELIQKALSALHAFHKDEHYIIVENKIQIVDEFTGRVMPDRSWERGLHQMIECKEGAEITGQRRTLSQMTYQRFFKRYLMLSGMTGTAKEIEPELKRVYDLSVVKIPTNKPPLRKYLPPQAWPTSEQRWSAVAKAANEIAQQGRAVLVGTRSVEASETLSKLFQSLQIEHTVLNARQDVSEAELVAQAGRPKKITVATNMAGRGTDIKPPLEVLKAGGLHVILSEFHESARIDRQLFGRSARQGQPGSVQAIVSLEDDCFKRYAPTLTRLTALASAPTKPISRSILKPLRYLAQAFAEAKQRRGRILTLISEQKRNESMGFVGEE
jgi:preprotein translocase subunit SecA